MAERSAVEPHRRHVLSQTLSQWAHKALGHDFNDQKLLVHALTHASHSQPDYQRLEFLGDRVLGLVIARWLYERFPDEPEGKLSRRLNVLVAGQVCAEVARAIGARQHLRLGKQARDDGAGDSDHVMGDITEALIGALLLDGGMEKAEAFIRNHWADRLDSQAAAPKHPKSGLQEWAAAQSLPPPEYTLVRRSGAHHAPRFEVEVSIKGREPVSAEGKSKQEAETRAAETMLNMLKK